MLTPLLATKLYIPPPRPTLITRPRLFERLDQGLHGALTLISAPAGFGKTTLVSAWLAMQERPVSWVSLDADDRDFTRFLTYFIAALQRVEPSLGTSLPQLLQSPQPPPTELLLTTLLNEVAAIPGQFLLVLDDYHVLEANAIDDALTYLLDHLPPQMHLIITTREDPPLPLARYRARGQLTELRAADLRFTPVEAAEFLNRVMGLHLSEDETVALETRTEGWIAGLQMAALSMQGRSDIANFIQAFTGSHRFVLDYLAEEVLQSQPEDVRDFLLQTAILDRFSGPLCDAVTSQPDGQARLSALERSNLFVVPLDDERLWYRYHHLFADVLRARLRESQPAVVPVLHQRASKWCEEHGLRAEAIHHAFAAEDFNRAADLVEQAWPVFLQGFQPTTWVGWVKTLPDELVRSRPVLSTGYGWTLLDHGELEAAKARLDDAERWLQIIDGSDAGTVGTGDDAGNMVVVNEKEFRSLPATLAGARAYLAQADGDSQAAVNHAQHALELLAEANHYWRGSIAMFLGLGHWTGGNLVAAYQAMSESVTHLHQAGRNHLQIVGTVMLADIRAAQGRLREAEHTYEQALQLARAEAQIADTQRATGPREAIPHGTVNLYVGLSEISCERGDLAAATQYLLQGKALGEQPTSPGSASRLCVAQARIAASQGELDSALDLLNEAEQLYKRDAIPDVRPVAALRARIWVQQGRLTQAQEWAQQQGLTTDDDLRYVHEFEHITLARLHLGEYQRDKVEQTLHAALDLLARLLRAAEADGRVGSVIEILVVQALAHQAQGDMTQALLALERALTLAEPEGYMRIFADEGEPMQRLMAESLARGIALGYVKRLLTVLNQQRGDETVVSDPNQLLIEPLSNRELDVLRLLAIGHTNQAVADELIIAVSTVKKHVNNIFGKLGVGNRTQAINRARELELV